MRRGFPCALSGTFLPSLPALHASCRSVFYSSDALPDERLTETDIKTHLFQGSQSRYSLLHVIAVLANGAEKVGWQNIKFLQSPWAKEFCKRKTRSCYHPWHPLVSFFIRYLSKNISDRLL